MDRVLDRIAQFDDRAREYPIRELVGGAALRSRSWACAPRLDQGREGACVGFAWTHELAARPVVVRRADQAFAFAVYREAQKIDEWPGEGYSGTSVLAGAKVLARDGYIPEYRWAFGIDDVLAALSAHGPVVLGIPWLDGMFTTRPSGLLEVAGRVAGGHAILARGVAVSGRVRGERGIGEPVVRLRNSWGRDYGAAGDCLIRASDLERLLKDQGDACVPVHRSQKENP